jgi:hypothetical protein
MAMEPESPCIKGRTLNRTSKELKSTTMTHEHPNFFTKIRRLFGAPGAPDRLAVTDPDIDQETLLASLTWTDDGQFKKLEYFVLETGGEDEDSVQEEVLTVTRHVDLTEQVFCKPTLLNVVHGDKETEADLPPEGQIGDVLDALNVWGRRYRKEVGTSVFSGLSYVAPGHWKADLQPKG